MKQIPVIALCGFLGSGKTTLLRRWRRDESMRDMAMIIHDLSEFGLDAELLSEEGATISEGQLNGRVAALHGRHASADLHASVGTALQEIAALNPAPPLVLCESTGAARPWPLIKALTQNDQFSLRHFIVTVDSLNLHRDFGDASSLLGDPLSSQDPALRQAAEVLAEQMAFANVIILTKVDVVPEDSVEKQVLNLQKLQPRAAIGLSANAGLLLSHLDNTPAPKISELQEQAQRLALTEQSSTADNIESLVLRDPRPFHPQRLHEACQSNLGTGLYRTKGYLWLASRPDQVLLWQQSGSQLVLELTGYWRAQAALNLDGSLLPEEVEQLKAQLADDHPIFGDRHNELTLIGLKRDREAFYSALCEALCTEEEIESWQSGETFADPWPKSIRHVK